MPSDGVMPMNNGTTSGLMSPEVLTPRERELYNSLLELYDLADFPSLPKELKERMEEIDRFFGPVTSGEILIAKEDFEQDAVVRWIQYICRTEEKIEWPKLE